MNTPLSITHLLLVDMSCIHYGAIMNDVLITFCQPQVGTCHLPLQGLNHVLLQLLTFNTFKVESRNEAQGGKKKGRQVFR